jgi:Sortase domain
MAITWPSMLRRVRPPGHVVAEVVLGLVVLAALAATPRDGVPADTTDSLIGPNVRYTVSQSEQPMFGLMALPGLNNLSGWASTSGTLVSSKALIPTAPPIQLLIPLLRVNRAVEAVGTNRYGVMNLPVNGWNAGWYKSGPVPGAPGDAVIEGHAGFPDQPMIFGKLDTLKPGAQVVVVLADKTKRLFVVESASSVPVGKAPPDMASPYGPSRLTLITCSGDFDATTHTYSRRLVVQATYSGIV